MDEDYKNKYDALARELRWFESYHRTMADHYRATEKFHLEELHETAWAEFYLLMQQFGIKTYDDEKALQNK